jgi:hypothetical protein
MTTTRRHPSTLVVATALLLLTACGDDDDTSATATTAAADDAGASGDDAGGVPAELADYCDAAAELNAVDSFPTEEQMRRYQELAPDEIQPQLEIVIPGFLANADNPEAAFADAAFRSALDEISSFEIETCGPEVAGDDPGEGGPTGEVDPEFADWCAAAQAITDADVPTEELLADAEATAPDELADDVAVVADAFREGFAAGDPGLGYVRESYDRIIVIDSFNDEHCGIPQDPGDFQDPAITTPDPSAAQVEVTATEFAFAFDPPTASGPTTFTLTNNGALAHVMVILQAA